MALPGLPYASKNYLLALAGLPLPLFLAIAWPIQALSGLPFLFLGRSAVNLDPKLALAAAALLAGRVHPGLADQKEVQRVRPERRRCLFPKLN